MSIASLAYQPFFVAGFSVEPCKPRQRNVESIKAMTDQRVCSFFIGLRRIFGSEKYPF